MNTHHNNPKKSPTTKINKYLTCGYSSFTHCAVDTTKEQLDCYRGKDCIEMFCKDLKEDVTKIINYEKEKTIPLTKKTSSAKSLLYIQKRFSTDDENKKYHKVIIVITQENME